MDNNSPFLKIVLQELTVVVALVESLFSVFLVRGHAGVPIIKG